MWEVGGFGLARAGWLYAGCVWSILLHVLYSLLIVCNCTCTSRDVRGYKHLYIQHSSALFPIYFGSYGSSLYFTAVLLYFSCGGLAMTGIRYEVGAAGSMAASHLRRLMYSP